MRYGQYYGKYDPIEDGHRVLNSKYMALTKLLIWDPFLLDRSRSLNGVLYSGSGCNTGPSVSLPTFGIICLLGMMRVFMWWLRVIHTIAPIMTRMLGF